MMPVGDRKTQGGRWIDGMAHEEFFHPRTEDRDQREQLVLKWEV